MYCRYFGFSEKPFDVTLQPRFFYPSSTHREALASLIYGIRERRGLMTLVGEVGTGKTTVLRSMLDRLGSKTKIAVIINPEFRFMEILARINFQLGLTRPKEKISKARTLNRLNKFAIRQLANGSTLVLIVDDAQRLSRNALENFRLLTNLEFRERKLIQIVLAGQPEFETNLRRHEMRPLAQRITLRRYILPLNKKETYGYIQHRLQVAGYSGHSFFSDWALYMIWKFSRGVPRRINILCDNALLIAYGRNKKKIKATVMREAVKDLSYSF